MTSLGAVQAAAAAAQGLRSARWRALGTSVQLVVVEDLASARARVERVLRDVDEAASRFLPDAEINRLPAGRWAEVSPLLARLLTVARDAAEWTDGLVDPTLGATLSDLGYDRTFRDVPRDGPAVLSVRRAVRWQDLEIDGLRVKSVPGLDLGATAKAVAADLAAQAVAPITDGLVSLGGDLASTRGRAWPVHLADQADPDQPADGGETYLLVDGGLATSGTTARRWTRGGQVLHHLLDPHTGRPAAGPWRTVSVVAETCALANVASTAAVVSGWSAEQWLAARGFSARLVARDGAVVRVGDWPDGPASC